MNSGYSGTPLARKLSLKDGQRVWWQDMPPPVRAEIESHGCQLQHLLRPEPPLDAAHVFVKTCAELESAIDRLKPLLAPAGFLWISWPKQAARIPSEINEDAIREVARTLKPVPGVYRMHDARGDVLYVGKAKALKNRVTSYTQVAKLPKRL